MLAAKQRAGQQNKKHPEGALWCIKKTLVPKRGLEPPHPCEYLDLNQARLPIPPLRHDCTRPWQIGAAMKVKCYKPAVCCQCQRRAQKIVPMRRVCKSICGHLFRTYYCM